MTTYERELIQQCEAIVTVCAAAGVPCISLPTRPTAPDTWLALRPALQALRVSRKDQRRIEHEIREDPDRHELLCLRSAPHGWQVLLVRLRLLTLTRVMYFGRHPVCTTYAVWHTGVVSALMQHGYYDPLTNHTPPAEHQLDAIERREEGRTMLNNLMPGMGDVFSGHRPTDNRAAFGYLVTDADGTQHFVRDSELPDEEEEEDDDGY
jgi:hypothetical protein